MVSTLGDCKLQRRIVLLPSDAPSPDRTGLVADENTLCDAELIRARSGGPIVRRSPMWPLGPNARPIVAAVAMQTAVRLAAGSAWKRAQPGGPDCGRARLDSLDFQQLA